MPASDVSVAPPFRRGHLGRRSPPYTSRFGGSADGSGLAGLADRIAALDGELTIVSPPGQGTTLHATIPLASAVL